MNIIDVNIESKVLARNEIFKVITPSHVDISDLPVLLLLHGMYGNFQDWAHKSEIAQLADEFKVVVIMPSGYNSFYADIYNGEKYYTYIKDEVFNTCRNLFNLTHDPEKTMVAGLSMGGYGALKIGLNNFDVFRHIGSFSPCPLLDYVRDGFEERINKLFGSFDNFKGSISDIRYVTSNISKCDMPNLYLYCGCNDFLYEMNLEYIKILEENELKFHFETDLGDHSWPYWNKHVRKFLEYVLKK